MLFTAVFCGAVAAAEPRPPIDARDWPTYNGDALGTRHNAGEASLSAKTVARLEEKWLPSGWLTDFWQNHRISCPLVRVIFD